MATDPETPPAWFTAHEERDEARHTETLAAVKAAHDAAKPTWTFDSKTLAGIVALIGAVTSLVTALGLGGAGQATAASPAHVVEQAQTAPAAGPAVPVEKQE